MEQPNLEVGLANEPVFIIIARPDTFSKLYKAIIAMKYRKKNVIFRKTETKITNRTEKART